MNHLFTTNTKGSGHALPIMLEDSTCEEALKIHLLDNRRKKKRK